MPFDFITPEYETEQLYTWVRDVAQDLCPECGEPVGFCYLICSRSEGHYSVEREREDTLYNDSLSQAEWMGQAVREFERVHGTPYVS